MEDSPILSILFPREIRGMLYETMISSTGVQYLGECDGLIWFLDPVTHSTHTLPLDEVSQENIEAVLVESRALFERKSNFAAAHMLHRV